MKSSEWASGSSSTVSIRFRVNGPGVFDHLFAHPAEARLFGVGGLAVQHPARLEHRHRRVVVRIVGLVGFVLDIEVVQVAGRTR